MGVPTRRPGTTTLEYEWDDGVFGCTWHLYRERLVAEDEERRAKQIAYLGYYGKQSMLQWGGVSLSEIDRAQEAVSDLISKINEQRET